VQPAQSSFIFAVNSGASNNSYRVEAMSGIRKAIFAFELPPPAPPSSAPHDADANATRPATANTPYRFI
jgi:hypothetical protein